MAVALAYLAKRRPFGIVVFIILIIALSTVFFRSSSREAKPNDASTPSHVLDAIKSALPDIHSITGSVLEAWPWRKPKSLLAPTSPYLRPDTSSEPSTDAYVAICLAVSNQALDLTEWFQHHYYNIGIHKFYVMDDGSEPPMSSFVDTYNVPPESIEFHYFHASARVYEMQSKLYDRCAEMAKSHNVTWVAFVDADEYFDTPGNESLRQVLEDIGRDDRVGAVGVNWRMHTSNGQVERANSTRKAYTECIWDDPDHDGFGSDNKLIKSIVRPWYYQSMLNPHKFVLSDGKITVGEHGDEISHYAWRQPPTRERVALHHYAVKSKEEYEEKIGRGNAMSDPKTWEFYDRINYKTPHEPCEEMLRWLD